MWNVYILFDPRTNKPFYVGKGKKQRLSATLNINQKSVNCLKRKFIEEIRSVNLEPFLEIVASYECETEAFEHEKKLIQQFGRIIKGDGCLTNFSDGGEGGNTGWNPSTQTRELWSDQRTGIKQKQSHIDKRTAQNTGKSRNETQKRNLTIGAIRRRGNKDLKMKIIEELETTEYYSDLPKMLSKKYKCDSRIISRIHEKLEIYKEALNDWIEE